MSPLRVTRFTKEGPSSSTDYLHVSASGLNEAINVSHLFSQINDFGGSITIRFNQQLLNKESIGISVVKYRFGRLISDTQISCPSAVIIDARSNSLEVRLPRDTWRFSFIKS